MADEKHDESISQDEIEQLLKASGVVDSEDAAEEARDTDGSSPADSPDSNDSDAAAAEEPVTSGDGVQIAESPQAAETPDLSKDPSGVRRGDVEYLLEQAERALESIDSCSPGEPPAGMASFEFQELAGASPTTDNATLDLISEVELDLKIELGRTQMHLEDVLRLRKGSVVSLDKLAGDPVDIYVNERFVARGEVLVMNDNFCVRVAELIAGAQLE